MGEPMTLPAAHTTGFDLVRRHSDRFVAYLGSMSADDLAAPVPDSDWTVGEVVAHVQSVYERYTLTGERAPTPAAVAEQNARDVERLGVDVAAAQRSIRAQVEQMAAIVPLVEPTAEFPFHGGTKVTLAAGWGNLPGELLAHGDDIARATSRAFTIPSDDLEITLRYTAPVLGAWLAPAADEADESWDVRFPFGTIRFAVVAGRLDTDPDAAPRPRHHLVDAEDAAEWLLAVPYRRRAEVDPVLARLRDCFVPL